MLGVTRQRCHTVTTLPWPARSPDLSLIEHIWDHFRTASWAFYEFERSRDKWARRNQTRIRLSVSLSRRTHHIIALKNFNLLSIRPSDWHAIEDCASAKSPSDYMREDRARKKGLKNSLLMLSLRDGNAIETLLMTAQSNTDFVNHLVPLTTEPSASLVRVGTDAHESKINVILRYQDYNSHKNAHKDFQKRFVDNPFGHGCSIYDRLWF
ncbi:uncharacterized protein TNCV_1999841 [Trichonephila clavipes]|nr:uncharacterized protein TNCV_1999841 [Trichonephila clavipes]